MRSIRWVCAAGTALLLAVGVPALTTVAQAAAVPVTTGLGASYGGPGHAFSYPAGYPDGSLVEAWSRTLSGYVSTPLVVGSTVVAGTRSFSTTAGNWADVQAFDAATGTPLWPPLAVGPGLVTMVSDGERIFALSPENVVAIDLASGRALWSRRLTFFANQAPALYGGLVWINTGTIGLVGLDAATGAVVHSYPNDRVNTMMAQVGHTLLTTSCGFDLLTGAPSYSGSGYCETPATAPSQSDGTVVVSPTYGDSNHLSVGDAASGGRLWSAPIGFAALDTGRVVLATSRAPYTLTSYSETTGSPGWSTALPSRPAGPVVVFGGTAAVLSADGHLRRYAVGTGALVDDTVVPGHQPSNAHGTVNAAAVDAGLLAVPGGSTLTVYRGSTTGTPPSLTAPAPARAAVPARATGTDHGDGSQYAEDAAHDGVAQGSTLAAPLHLAWSKALPGVASNAIVDSSGRVFVAAVDPAGGFDVYRLNRRTGAPVWGPVHFTGGVNLDRVQLAEGAGLLVDLENGIYTGSGSSALLHGIDPATGAVRWTTALADTIYGYDGYPTISGGTLFIHHHDSTYGGFALAFDVQTGKPAWATNVEQAYDTLAPAAGGGRVYYSGVTDQLYGLDASTGAPVFHADSDMDGGGTSSDVYGAGRVYVNDFTGGGHVFDATTGLPAGPGMFATRRPAVHPAANLMVALQGNRVTAESLTDRTRYWTVKVGAVPSVSPVIANRMVFTGDNSGRLLVLDEATGRQLWSDPHAFPASSVNIVQDTEPAQLTVGAGGLALTAGNQLRFYAGSIDNGPATP